MQGCAWVLRNTTDCPFRNIDGLRCLGCKPISKSISKAYKPKQWVQLELEL